MGLSDAIKIDANCPSCGFKASDSVSSVSLSRTIECTACQHVIDVDAHKVEGVKSNLDNLEMSISRKRSAKLFRPIKRFFRRH